MKIYYKKRAISVDVKKVSFFEEFYGLMFRSRETKNLLFDFSNYNRTSLHSLFVFFPFLVVWLDEKNKVLDFKIVKPFTFSVKSKMRFQKFIEIPLNLKNKSIIEFFRREGKL